MTSNFSLDTFVHPLRKHLTSSVRALIFMTVQDNFHDGLEQIACENRSFLYVVYGRYFHELLTPDGTSLNLSSMNAAGYFGWNRIQLGELAMLFQMVGDVEKVQQINQGMRQLKLALRAPDKLNDYYPLAQWYLIVGEFSQAIRFAEDQLSQLQTPQHSAYSSHSRGSLLGIISRCYEMQGAFEESIKWKLQQLSEEKSKDNCYRDLARLYLKAGQFGKAADTFRSFSTWREDGDSRWWATALSVLGGDDGVALKLVEDLWPKYRSGYAGGVKTFKWFLEEGIALTKTLEEQGFFEAEARIYEITDEPLRAAEAYENVAEKHQQTGNKGQADEFWRRAAEIYTQRLSIHDVIPRFKQKGHIEDAVMQALVREYRERGKLRDLARALEENGFFEEAAKIYDEMGQGTRVGGPKVREIKENPRQEGEEEKGPNRTTVTEETSEELSCPECGAEVKPHWTVCPKCDADLKQRACRNCGEPLETDWTKCPVCMTPVTGSR